MRNMYTFWVTVGLSRISSQLPVSHLGEWRHICHLFRWQKIGALHLSHFWEECDALAHENIFWNWDVFCHILPQKRHILAPRVQKNFEREEMWRFGWDWNMFSSCRLRFVTYLGSVKGKAISAKTDPYVGTASQSKVVMPIISIKMWIISKEVMPMMSKASKVNMMRCSQRESKVSTAESP